MKRSKVNFSSYRHSGKVLFATMMLVFVFVILLAFLSVSDQVSAFSSLAKAESQLNKLNTLKTMIIKPKVGVMNGIIYSPPSSSALIDQTIVHEGDKINGVVVAAIHNSSVEFAKDGVSWQQSVFNRPNTAWTSQTKDIK